CFRHFENFNFLQYVGQLMFFCNADWDIFHTVTGNIGSCQYKKGGHQKRIEQCPEPVAEVFEINQHHLVCHFQNTHQSLSSLPVNSRKILLSDVFSLEIWV